MPTGLTLCHVFRRYMNHAIHKEPARAYVGEERNLQNVSQKVISAISHDQKPPDHFLNDKINTSLARENFPLLSAFPSNMGVSQVLQNKLHFSE